MRFDTDNQHPVKTGFRALPWLVRWAVYVLCLCIILPPACVVVGVVGGIGYAAHEGYQDQTAQRAKAAKATKQPRTKP
jgi:hypothetical protein